VARDDSSASPVSGAGRDHRRLVPRRALGSIGERPADFDAVAHLAASEVGGAPSLRPLRHQRMLESPWTFLRGAASLMASDLARAPHTSIEVQICGDAHVANFGVFASPEGRMVFDVDDFDETDQGPFEWDVKRLVTSLAVAVEEFGLKARAQRAVIDDALRAYQHSIRRFATRDRLEVWYSVLDVEDALSELHGYFSDDEARVVDDIVRRTRSVSPREKYERLLESTEHGPRISIDPPRRLALGESVGEASLSLDDLSQLLARYRATLESDRRALVDQFTLVDAVHQVMGIGSVGRQCYALLLTGRDESDPFVLQVKEVVGSVASSALERPGGDSPAARVVSGQRLMQATPDLFLGWASGVPDAGGRSFYVRQLFDGRATVDLARLDEGRWGAYARACAWVLAHAHARSGRAQDIAGYLGTGDRFVTYLGNYALEYRERNRADYEEFRRAAQQGRVAVAT
jgi:uncharacterized protein (DUF2252 family)